jgi:hypothetical protein
MHSRNSHTGGTKPLLTLKTSEPDPNACAVNPNTGDLAVAQMNDFDDAGGLFVFSSGSSKPAYYQARNMFFYYFVGYDASGNAFVDGYGGGGHFQLDELPNGGKTLIDVTPAGLKVGLAGGVQYDGKYTTVGDQKLGRRSHLPLSGRRFADSRAERLKLGLCRNREPVVLSLLSVVLL